jgi:hypothetical protein
VQWEIKRLMNLVFRRFRRWAGVFATHKVFEHDLRAAANDRKQERNQGAKQLKHRTTRLFCRSRKSSRCCDAVFATHNYSDPTLGWPARIESGETLQKRQKSETGRDDRRFAGGRNPLGTRE